MMMVRGWMFAALFVLVSGGHVAAQDLPSGPQVLSFFSDVDDTDQPYAIYIPPNFDEGKKYPLVMSLHGAGSNHRLNLRRVFGRSNAPGESDVEASRYFPEWEDVDFIVAAPYARGTMGYQGIAEKDVLDVLDDVKRRFPVDDDRVYLTGLSMGGGGALWLGLTRPDIWAAIAPVCPAPPAGTEALAPNALNVPVHIFQGGADPVVRPEVVRQWVDRLREAGVSVEYTEYPGVGHDSWVNAYADGQIFDWFAQFRRSEHPERVRFASTRYAHNEAYWVRLDAITPGTLASVDARFTGENRIEVETSGLDGFTLRPAGHPRYRLSGRVIVRIDGIVIDAPASPSISFSREAGDWFAEAASPAEKRKGSEGPLREAVASRHIYVYGTGGDPSPEELRERQLQAVHAGTWSVDRGPFWGRVMVFPRIVSDKEVRPSDLQSANLILLGTKETNSLIDDRLPLHLPEHRTDVGLAYVYPSGDRYVLVSSGLPFWEVPSGGSFSFANQIPAMTLADRQDYILFTADSILVEGRFDENWEIMPDDRDRIDAVFSTADAGTVRVESGLLTGTGTADGLVRIFKGIPFAAPPVGELRWRAPEAAGSWEGVRPARSFGPGCIQDVAGSRPPWTEEFMHQGEVSEDCLYLNVWAPSNAGERPVLVYIHGGGFNEGSGSVALYDGEELARKGLVVVTINYRLGPLGFLAHPELREGSVAGASGNYGLLDQVAALRWVRDNIGAFGGDPENVTIAGQSAGAISVYLLTASPMAAGLFHRAVVQSGPGGLASFGLSDARSMARPLEEVEEQGVKFARDRGAESVDELRAMSVSELRSGPPVRLGAAIDGWFLPDDVETIYAEGRQNDVPMLAGMTADEASAFPGYGKTTSAEFETQARERYGPAAEEFLRMYAASSDGEAGRSKIASMRDLGLTAMSRLALQRSETSGMPVYLYYFERSTPWPEHPEFGAHHTAEVPYVFDNLRLLNRPAVQADYDLAETVSAYWANFAATGDPNGTGLPYWPSFTETDPRIMVLGEEVEPRLMPDDERRRFFEAQLQR